MFQFVQRSLPLFMLLFILNGLQAQNYNPDVTPPTAVCDEFTVVALSAIGQTEVFAAGFDDGSFDDCCLDTLLVRRQVDGPCDGDNQSDAFAGTVTFCCADIGTVIIVELQAKDCSGNSSQCTQRIEVTLDQNYFVRFPDDVVTDECNNDPTDKQVFPTGYGAEHLVEANVNLDYLIRFQNTGTDTAFNVVILDTISSLMDISSVRPGPAGLAYTFAVLDGNVLRFSFNNIMLPDSHVNEPASNGFVKFSIQQQPDLPDGSRIENSAAIYFDFNEPVITNTTFLTVGDHFISVGVDPAPGYQTLKVYPNPAMDAVFF